MEKAFPQKEAKEAGTQEKGSTEMRWIANKETFKVHDEFRGEVMFRLKEKGKPELSWMNGVSDAHIKRAKKIAVQAEPAKVPHFIVFFDVNGNAYTSHEACTITG